KRATKHFESLVTTKELGFHDVCAANVVDVELLREVKPGDGTGCCAALSDELRFRWSFMRAVPLRVYFANRKTIYRLGGSMPGRIDQLDSISHDLGMSSTFLKLIDLNAEFRRAWVPETRLPTSYRQAHPDAALADSSGPRALIEFCGKYTAERLE